MKNQRALYSVLVSISAAALVGCSSTPPIKVNKGRGGNSTRESKGCPECAPPSPDTPESILAVRDALSTACAPCHSGRGGVARGDFGSIFDVPDMVRRGLVVPGDPEKSRLWSRISDEQMPPADATDPRDPLRKIAALDETQRETIRAWIAAGAAPLRGGDRAPIGSNVLLDRLRDDLRSINAAERVNVRYISLHVYYNDTDIPQGDLDSVVNAVSKLLNHLSPLGRRVVPPQQVFGPDGEVVALRLNLRDYDLDAEDWARIEEAAEVIDRVAFPCDVPLINADQFLAIASTDQHLRTDGTLESLYSNIVVRKLLERAGVTAPGQLVFEPVAGVGGARQVQFLTSPITMPQIASALGVDLVENMRRPRNDVSIRACTRDSGVSEAVRCMQRDSVPDGDRGFWWSMDFINKAGADENANPFVTPIGPLNGDLVPDLQDEPQFTIAGGEAFWSWPNYMVGYALYDGQLNLISSAPQDAVKHPANVEEAAAIENAISCFDCHSSHVLRMADDMRPFLKDNRQLSAAERGFVEELFPEQEFFDGRNKLDNDNFADELRDVYLKQGESGELPDGIFKLMVAYERDPNMNYVAAALFSTPENVADQVRDNEALQQIAPTLTDAKLGFISRQDFVLGFKELRANIGPNDTLLNFCVQPNAEIAGEGGDGEDGEGESEGDDGDDGDDGSDDDGSGDDGSDSP